MKKFSYIFAILAAGMFVSSCLDEKVEPYTPAAPDVDGCYRVSFPEQTVTEYELDPTDETASTVTIKAKRKVTTGAITVPLTITQAPYDKDFVFTNTDLTFADGDAEATFQVSFPSAETGVEYSCHITIEDPQYASAFAKDTTYFSFTFLKVKWNKLNEGVFTSGRYGSNDPTKPDEVVSFEACETFPGRYRISNFYEDPIVFEVYGDPQVYEASSPGDPDDGKEYYCFRMTDTLTGEFATAYGEYIYMVSYASYMGDDSLNDTNTQYFPESGNWYSYNVYAISLGGFSGGWDSYIPNSSGGE